MAVPDRTRSGSLTAARAGFASVVVAASVSGLALLVWPDETGEFFSWGLGPPPLASLVGGLYLASAVTFGVAIRLPWRYARSLVAASVALTVPTLIATFIHLDVFDFSRWQAVAWLVLFIAAPLFWTTMLVVNRAAVPREERRVRWPSAVALLALAVLLVVLAIVLWIDPAAGPRVLPFEPSPLGGRFIGCWAAFLAVMATRAALRPAEAKLPLIALVAYPLGALVAGLRSFSDLSPPGARWTYLAVLGLTAAVFGVWVLRTPEREDSAAR
ncbi:MAG TPA: hypothetical protein VFZ63_19125 [Jiangellaceae bacterium]